MMRYGESADDAFHAKVEDYCTRVRATTPGVVSYDYVANIADRSKGFDHAIIGVFDRTEDHDAYQVSPLHQEMKAHIMPHVRDIVVCDADYTPALVTAPGKVA